MEPPKFATTSFFDWARAEPMRAGAEATAPAANPSFKSLRRENVLFEPLFFESDMLQPPWVLNLRCL